MRALMVALTVALMLFVCGCTSLGTRIDAPHTTTPWLTLSYVPGMIGKPWQALITEDGRVSVTVEGTTYLQWISTAELRGAVTAARLDEMKPLYSVPYSDLPTLRINGIAVYGPHDLCEQPDVCRFLRVWNAAVSRVRAPDQAAATRRSGTIECHCSGEIASGGASSM